MTTEEKFRAAVNVIKGLPKDGPYQPSNEMKLTFYGLYKQATEGPCTEPKPSFYQVIAGYKWQAWKSMGQLSKQEAMERYIVELKKIVETMSYSADVATFMEILGPFYEYIDVPSKTGKSSPEDDDLQAHNLDQQICTQNPHSFGTGDESADSAVSLEYEVPEKLNMVGVNGIHAPNGIIQEIVECSDKVNKLKGSLKNGVLSNGDVKRNGVVSRGSYPHLDESRHAPLASLGDVVGAELGLRSGKSVASDSDSDDEYAVPPEEISGDECAMMNGVHADDATLHSAHPTSSPHEPLEPVSGDPLHINGRVCDSGAYGLADTSSASGRSSACDLGRSGLIQPSSRSPNFSPYRSRSMDIPGLSPVKSIPFTGRPDALNRNTSASLQADGSGAVMREEGGHRGVGGGDDVVLVLRQMQGDLQAMTQCLQAHLNDISQCLAALHRTSIALQAHSEGAGGGGGGGGGGVSPGNEVTQRRQRQWWPFPELSPRSTFWLLVWPVLLHASLHAFKIVLKMRMRRKK